MLGAIPVLGSAASTHFKPTTLANNTNNSYINFSRIGTYPSGPIAVPNSHGQRPMTQGPLRGSSQKQPVAGKQKYCYTLRDLYNNGRQQPTHIISTGNSRKRQSQ
mmetsp:Transcript_15904/g.24525  ORF Transcript_15904/g.24525 Transcript_15904/m.24525 type:complete len:105 (+) Transcript_15904:1438-1752(+)